MLEANKAITLLSLRLLIARAAQKDSLNWWEDDSLTKAGNYLFERLIYGDATEVSRRLALEAAKVRYQAAFSENFGGVMHLFHLDQTGEVEYSLKDLNLAAIQIPEAAIPSLDAYRALLLEQIGQPMKYQIIGERGNNCLEISRGNTTRQPDIIEIIKTLAWATLESEPGKPNFPFIRQTL